MHTPLLGIYLPHGVHSLPVDQLQGINEPAQAIFLVVALVTRQRNSNGLILHQNNLVKVRLTDGPSDGLTDPYRSGKFCKNFLVISEVF